MKKPTTLSVLIDMNQRLKNIENFLVKKEVQSLKPEVAIDNYFKITDYPDQKTSDILSKIREKFDVWCSYDDAKLDADFPPPKKETTRFFKKTIEADEELKNKSANDLEKEGIKGITLRERLIMELQYFEETGKHLDVENWTLCSGSRYSGGFVPYVDWDPVDRKVQVYWHSADYRSPRLRARAAVSITL